MLFMMAIAGLVAALVGLVAGGVATFVLLLRRDANAVLDSYRRVLDEIAEIASEEYEENGEMCRAGILSQSVALRRSDLIRDRVVRLREAVEEHRQRVMWALIVVPSDLHKKAGS